MARFSPSFVVALICLLWVCLSRCWFELTMTVIFVVMVTTKMIAISTLFFRGKKQKEKRRVERETMRGRGLLSNRIDKDKLKAGDHIYTWRNGYTYAHHGVYGEDGKVIHLTRGGGQKFGIGTAFDSSPFHSKDKPMNPCPTCGVQLNRGGVRVISSCMDCFLSGGNLYLFHYGVSVAYFLAKLRGGTSTLAPSDPPEKGNALNGISNSFVRGFFLPRFRRNLRLWLRWPMKAKVCGVDQNYSVYECICVH